MTGPEIALFAVAVLLALTVLTAEGLRARGVRLSANMLLIRISLGIVFAILGVIGSILPIMQGWVFFLLAALVLFPQSRFAVRTLDKIEPRMPRLVRWLRGMGVGCPREARYDRAE